jgi:hypothetical protein
VVTRCVKRLQALGLIVVNRLGTSINLLRLSYAGARYLEAEGLLPAADIHVPRKPTSLKDLAHSLSVVDTMIALELGFDGSRQLAVRPCWALRRALTGSRFHVPDIAAVTDDGKAALLVEVDYATEGLRELAPRLCELAQQAPLWLEASEIRILVLTIGTRRENSLRARLASLAPAVPITVAQLPPSSSTSIDALITILTNTSEVAPS